MSALFLARRTGRTTGSLRLIQDDTERVQAQAVLRFACEVARVLDAATDYEATMRGILGVAVPALADWCTIDLLDQDGARYLAGAAHLDPTAEALIHAVRRRYPIGPGQDDGWSKALRTGEPTLRPEIPDALLRAHCRDRRHYRMLCRLGCRAVVILPLRSRACSIGVMALVSGQSGPRYGPAEFAMAEELARRAGPAIDSARLAEIAARGERRRCHGTPA